jgi:hypothetical protein
MPIYKIIERVALYVEADTPEDAIHVGIDYGCLDNEVEDGKKSPEGTPRFIDWEWHSRLSVEESK